MRRYAYLLVLTIFCICNNTFAQENPTSLQPKVQAQTQEQSSSPSQTAPDPTSKPIAETKQTLHDYNNDQQKSIFNVAEANDKFDKISLKLSTQNLNFNILSNAVQDLEDLQKKAKSCVNNYEAELQEINTTLEEMEKNLSGDQKPSDYKFLQDKKNSYNKSLSDCRLFVYRTDEALVAYKNTLQSMSSSKLFKQSTPIWGVFETKTSKLFQNIEISKLYANCGIDLLDFNKLVIGGCIIIIFLIIALYIKIICRRQLKLNDEAKSKFISFYAVANKFILPLAFFTSTSIIFSIICLNALPKPTLELLSYSTLIFILSLAIARYVFYPSSSIQPIVPVPNMLGKKFYKRFLALSALAFISYVLAVLLRGQDIPSHASDLARTFLAITLGMAITWFCWLFCRIPIIKKQHKSLIILFKATLIFLLSFMIIAELLGFHNLAVFLIYSWLLTIGLIFCTIVAVYLIKVIFDLLEDQTSSTGQFIARVCGIRPLNRIPEFTIIRFSLYVSIALISAILLMSIWHLSVNFIDSITNGILEGFNFANIKLVPSKILLSFILFATILLTGRIIANYISTKDVNHAESEKQVAIASIIFYIFFTIALLFALLVAGVNFTGLAIIGGALSVGIGLGLQDIVNNFASGLVLLLEKPIKPGDRVLIGETEGFVKKISARSTRISTMAKEDVIIPNSDLITNKLINYMYFDRLWRVECKVGVAYGSDVELVKESLLEVAHNNPDVLKTPPNEPTVLFQEFGDNSLLFELWCIIRNVNKKYIIASDINFAINEIFVKNNITIAFPQRDVHIKEHIVYEKKPDEPS